ncbi:hypothetical protein Patl1_16771 [Pistacia atlantica]|uniref:Uncharacterized protein n=1 Tax=Pistacia atlantica TaxID=434234 RepID=A0ACC1B768_9ROSI|nr:hypothetical protein Patl1_16771 [Pistacia atlantica]
MSIPPVSLHTILSESNRIIKEHSLHFKVLGVLFLFPISYSISLYPILKPQLLLLDQKSLILALSYTAFVFVLSLCATSSITYSVFKGFYVFLFSVVKFAEVVGFDQYDEVEFGAL